MIIIPAIFDNLRTLSDKSIKITFTTNELNPQELLGLMEVLHSFGYLAFKAEPFKAEEKELMQELKSDFDFKGKSSSQRLRAVLFLMYQQDNEGFDSSIKHYEHHLSKVIEHFKSKLP